MAGPLAPFDLCLALEAALYVLLIVAGWLR
jgi:hypothetical protein